MLGRIETLQLSVILISGIACLTDLRSGKIYNWLTFPATLLGLAFALYSSGWEGLIQSTLGIFAGLLLFGWMFGLRFLGAGDVKLLMALGAWGGARFSLEVALLSIGIGGLIAGIILALNGRLVRLFKEIYRFLLSMAVPELELQFPKLDRSLTMPFGLSIALAAVWTVFFHPLVRCEVFLH